MRIEINLKIILLLILFILLQKIDIYVTFILFIFLHELTHLLVGILVGFKPEILSLNPLGVSIEFYNYGDLEKKNRFKRILTYLAGPALNFLVAIVCYFINFDVSLKTEFIYTNILIGSFNLIPILPLDGGKIFKEVLNIFLENKIAFKFMIVTTKVILLVITFLYSIAIFKIKNLAIFFLILYLWYLYYIEEKRYKALQRVYDMVGDVSSKL